MKKGKILKILAVAAIVLLFAGVTVWLFPYVLKLSDENNRTTFSEFLGSFGIWGILIMLAIQILQVIFAVIPGEPIEILAGVMYGTWGGLAICLVGVFVASAGVFLVAKKLGYKYIEKMLNSEKYSKFKFLRDPTSRDLFIFILFAIPGTPKDVLTYFAPCTGITTLRFLVICTFSRIPSVISSTYVGENFAEGNIILSLCVFAATAVIGVAGIWINNIFVTKRQNKQCTIQIIDNDK